MTRRVAVAASGRRALAPALLGVILAYGGVLPAAAEAPPAQPAPGVGTSGLVWGRLAVEEESPEGSWTPLAGVEVAVFPYEPALAADLDRIRERARVSGADYVAAVTRLRERLGAWETQARGATGGAEAGGKGGVVRRETTDRSGIFAFPELPAGEWLLVALRISPYSQPSEHAAGRNPTRRGKGDVFLPRPALTAKEAEVWLARVRLGPGERARVLLTDRSRFMVGPVR